ncbi:MAG: undecaprenyldiphospho-muramoylpentapeptide beta-N-acetylglucosaminyltransferase, partial [Caulobacteraceae bacterium]
MTASNRVVVVAAGGTGGHLFPAEALARVLTERGWRVVLATDSRGDQYADGFPAEERLALEAATFKIGDPIAMLRGWLRIRAGVKRARRAYTRLRPAVVVGFGGYPSLPALIAAKQARIPRLIHEQNAVLGRVNRYLSKRVDKVACAFPILKKAPSSLKPEVVGNPVRPDIRALYDEPYIPPGGTLRLLVTGGSQGAKLLSETVPAAVAQLPEALRLILRVEQQTRMDSLDFARRTYQQAGVEAEVAPFFRNMAKRLSSAQLVIGRAGASTVCELAVAGRPSILVPLAIAADDHQTYNAELLADAGAAVILTEKKFTAAKLAEVLEGLLTTPNVLAKMAAGARDAARPDAAERLADLVEA